MNKPSLKIVKNEYEVPCDHPACPVMHRHLDNVRYEKGQWETYHVLGTWEEKQVWKTSGHVKQRVEWVIIDEATDERVLGIDDAFDTKRDAKAAMDRFLDRHPGA